MGVGGGVGVVVGAGVDVDGEGVSCGTGVVVGAAGGLTQAPSKTMPITRINNSFFYPHLKSLPVKRGQPSEPKSVPYVYRNPGIRAIRP